MGGVGTLSILKNWIQLARDTKLGAEEIYSWSTSKREKTALKDLDEMGIITYCDWMPMAIY